MSMGRIGFFVGGVALLVSLGGCDRAEDDVLTPQVEADAQSEAQQAPSGELRTHEIVPSTPTAEGLAYIQAVAGVHREADGLQGSSRVEVLQRGLALEVPRGLPEAEVLRLELASRVATVWLQAPEGGSPTPAEAAKAKALLQPMLDPAHSLPLDRSSAEALVLLGDAASRVGDDALAAGTYARSIRMMSILRQELER